MAAGDATRPSYADASRELLRSTVLGAVGDLLADRNWEQVTMADVAARAGVSRQTLYNSFGSRPELAQAYVIREAEGFLEAVTARVRARSGDPHEALRAALELFLAAAETHPLVRAISQSRSGDELLPLLTTRGGPVLGLVTDGLAEAIAELWPPIPLDEIRPLTDALVRLAISHAALPADSPRRTAEAVVRILAPYLDQLIARLDAAERSG